MLHILVLILKILGILFLILLGLLLFFAVIVLFVPVRYQVEGRKEEDWRFPKGQALISWLFRILTVRAAYEESLVVTAKVFGRTLFREVIFGEEEEDDFSGETGELQEKKEKEKKEPAPPESAEGEREPEPAGFVGSVEEGQFPAEEKKADSESGPKPGPVTKFLKKIGYLFRKICGMLKKGLGSYEKVRDFLENAENQATIRLLLRQIKKLMKHILPQKLSGWLRFGFADPYQTGQVLGYASLFYGFYAKTFEVIPVFEGKALSGETHIKGRIRAGSLLWIGLRIFFDKNFRTLLKKWTSG